MKTAEQYQGWTNYETWLMALWFDNDQDIYSHVTELVAEDKDASDGAVADKLEEYADHLVENEDIKEGFIRDFVTAGLSEVNWREIVLHYREDSND